MRLKVAVRPADSIGEEESMKRHKIGRREPKTEAHKLADPEDTAASDTGADGKGHMSGTEISLSAGVP
jgi:hypothetical protein